MQLVVEATGVTDGLPVGVPPPEGGGVGPAVGAAGAFSLGGGLNKTRYIETLSARHDSPGDVWV